jgi:membrane fusion protein, multidrug efflux system
MKLTKKRVGLIAAVMAAIIVTAIIPKKHMAVPEDTQKTYSVTTTKLAKQNMQEYLIMNGNIKADNSISVYPDIGGKLVNVPVTLGSFVKRGQMIAEVDPSTPGTVYARSPVYAPIEGYVTSLPLTQGTTVSTSTAIAQLGNITKLQISSKVPERDVGVLKNGLTAVVTLSAYPNDTFPAHVFRVSPIVDETSRTKEIYYIFDTTDPRINAGMYARIKLNTVLHQNIIVIPVDSYVTDNGKKYVYTVNSNETVTKKEIQTGVTVDGKTEVTAGLAEGDRIVVTGLQILTDGVTVNDIGGK